MKLLLCIECNDIRSLTQELTYCRCRKAVARYIEDGKTVTANDSALIMAIDNATLKHALERKVDHPSGSQKVDSFLLPEPCRSVSRIGYVVPPFEAPALNSERTF